MILLGMDAFYLVWLDLTLRRMNLVEQLRQGYTSSFANVMEGPYVNDMWPLHVILLALGLIGAISLLAGFIEYSYCLFKNLLKKE